MSESFGWNLFSARPSSGSALIDSQDAFFCRQAQISTPMKTVQEQAHGNDAEILDAAQML